MTDTAGGIEGPDSAKILQNNLRALEKVDPLLAKRVGFPVSSAHIRQDPGEPAQYRYRRQWHRLSLTPEEINTVVQGVQGAPDLFVFGLGGGEHVLFLLDKLPAAQLTVWDRDPWLSRLFLMQRDLSGHIMSGRLRLTLCADLLDHLPLVPSRPVVIHPLFRMIYRHEFHLMQQGIGEKRSLVCEGELFVDDLSEALVKEGYSLFTLDTDLLSAEEMAIVICRFQPEFIAAIDYKNGMAEFCQAQGVRLVCWEINPTTDRIQACAAPTEKVFIFTYRAAQVQEFREAGFCHVEYLPLAANPERRKPLRLDEKEQPLYKAELSFVGSSMVEPAEKHRVLFIELFKLERPGDVAFEENVAQRLEAVLKEQRRDFSTFRIPQLFEQHFKEILHAWPAQKTSENPLVLLGEIAASEKRLRYISALGSLGVTVWGDPGWQSLTRLGVRYAGEAGHLVELTKIYCATLVNIDVGRFYQSDIVPMRVFDVLSCGGFLLAEYSEALEDLFELGHEVESYKTLEELSDKAAFYRGHPDSAREIAGKGMERVRSMHTIQGRVRRMVKGITPLQEPR